MQRQLLDHADLDALGIKPRSRVQRWRLVKQGRFPRPVKSGKSNLWLSAEIAAYVQACIADRDHATEAR
jgi:predicted DNA-binding transcriptional regulator AlpA